MSRLHLAGIIPVAALTSDFELKTPEVLLPVAAGLTAIQKSVIECAYAGCNTIWIVANDDLAPIIRKTVGDWVYDPVYYKRDLESKFYSQLRKEIPIYYVPIHPKDRARRDSYGWSVLYGIYSAWRTAHKVSHWLTPQKYFVSFPFECPENFAFKEDCIFSEKGMDKPCYPADAVGKFDEDKCAEMVFFWTNYINAIFSKRTNYFSFHGNVVR